MGGYTRELPDGTIAYSASSIGYCSAALYYDRLGVTHEAPPESIQKAWTEGHDNESRIMAIVRDQRIWTPQNKDWLREDGWSFGEYDEDRGQDYSDQVRGEKRVGTGVVIRCHLDGIATIEQYPPGYISDEAIYQRIENAEGRAIVEAKAFGDSYWDKWRSKGLAAFPVYEWQVSVQMHATGLPCLFAVGKKDKAGVVQSVDARLILTAPISWGKIAAKISRIETAVDKREVPKCEEPIMYPCPFYPMHESKVEVDIFGQQVDGANAPEVKKLDAEEAASFDVFVERMNKHEELAKQHEEEAKHAKKMVGEFMAKHGENKVPVQGNKFRVWPKPGGRKGAVDATALAAEAGLDVEKFRKADVTWVSYETEAVTGG